MSLKEVNTVCPSSFAYLACACSRQVPTRLCWVGDEGGLGCGQDVVAVMRAEEVVVVLVVVLASKQGQFQAPLSARQERHGQLSASPVCLRQGRSCGHHRPLDEGDDTGIYYIVVSSSFTRRSSIEHI